MYISEGKETIWNLRTELKQYLKPETAFEKGINSYIFYIDFGDGQD